MLGLELKPTSPELSIREHIIALLPCGDVFRDLRSPKRSPFFHFRLRNALKVKKTSANVPSVNQGDARPTDLERFYS